MKKQWIVLTVVCSALMANAGVVTNFFADFQGAADGNISTAADINAGTAIGSWNTVALEESYFDSNPASNRRLALDQGKYDFTASLATPATLAHGVTFSIDFRNLRDGNFKYNDIRLKTDGGWNLLSLRLVPTDNSTGNPDWLQRWNPDTTSWTNVVEIFQNSPAIPNEVGMQTLQVVMDADGFGLFLDGSNLVGNLDYDSPGGTLESIRLSSPNTASGVWYDDISVLTQPVNSHFLADFQGAADGSITTNLDLNAGTSVGSWTTVALEESYFDSNPASNRRLALDQGTYDVTGVLSSNAVLANGVFFSIDFRNLRDGNFKYNDIRLKTAGGFNLLSLRLVPTDNSSGLPDWLQRWNPDTASWTNVVEIFQNSPAIPNEVGMQTLQVGMDADGFGLFLDGSNLVGNLSYEYPGTTLQSFRLSSPDTASGVWYDDISIVALQNTNAPPVDPYIDWTIEMGLDGTNNGQGDDPDGDGNDNLMEYAVGGDPLVVDKAALLANDGAFFYHIHKERTDDANLTYTVELDDNLVASDWGTAGITNVGESALVDNYKTVTNRTDLNNQEFIKLSVEKN